MAESDYEKTIKRLLKAQRRPLTTFKISRKTDISWPTTRKYLQSMGKKGSIKKTKIGSKNLWEINRVLLRERLMKKAPQTRQSHQ